MQLSFLRIVAAVLAAVVMVPTTVQAALVTYNFSGEVRPGVSDTDFPVGDTFSGFFILDTYTSLFASNSELKWLGLFEQFSCFYKWVSASVMPRPGLVAVC